MMEARLVGLDDRLAEEPAMKKRVVIEGGKIVQGERSNLRDIVSIKSLASVNVLRGAMPHPEAEGMQKIYENDLKAGKVPDIEKRVADQVRTGGIFTDEKNNIVFVARTFGKENPFYKLPKQAEGTPDINYFNFANPNAKFEIIETPQLTDKGSGWQRRASETISKRIMDANLKGWYLPGLIAERNLTNSQIGLVFRRDEPISFSDITQILAQAIILAIQAVPGVGSAIGSFINVDAVMSVLNLLATKNLNDITATQALTLLNDVSKGLLPAGNVATKYIGEATAVYSRYQNGDPTGALLQGMKTFGISSTLGTERFENLLAKNDIVNLQKVARSGQFDRLNAFAQNYRNVKLFETNKHKLKLPDYGKSFIDEPHKIMTDDNFFDLMVASCSGGYAPMIPLIEPTYKDANGNYAVNHILPYYMYASEQISKRWFTGTNRFAHVGMLNLAVSSPVEHDVFDHVLLDLLEYRIANMPKGEFVMPMGLTVEKRELFAKLLASRGFNVLTTTPEASNAEKKAVEVVQLRKTGQTTNNINKLTSRKNYFIERK